MVIGSNPTGRNTDKKQKHYFMCNSVMGDTTLVAPECASHTASMPGMGWYSQTAYQRSCFEGGKKRGELLCAD